MIQRVVPFPLLSVALGLTWLLLNGSTALGHVLLAVGTGLAIPWLIRPLLADLPRLKHGRTVVRLLAVVLADMVVANFDVARRVLGREDAICPRFVWMPLRLQEDHGLVALAAIISLTPGTVSCKISPDRRHLLIHVLHCPDEAAQAALIGDIQSRYESPLKEIFE